MDDVAKILLGSAAGFVAGTLADPVKKTLNSILTARHIRRAIKHTASYLFWEMRFVITGDKRYIPIICPYDELRFYMDKDAAVFWRTRGAHSIRALLQKRDDLDPADKKGAAEILVQLHVLSSRGFPFYLGRRVSRDVNKSPELWPVVFRLLGWESS